ncbi:MAG: GntR family transcriptional regulator [Osedax symbiont Rs1]|nr:MAG: GntR family transcriptional regulator [Osedax symbiont Rs1]
MTVMKESVSKTLSSDLYGLIKSDIINGRFAPGDKLRTEVLRTLYQVGNSPLREALTRLAATGLINQENQRGFRIPPVSSADLQDICACRMQIEVAALQRAIEKGDDRWEADLLGAFHRLKKSQQNAQVGTAHWEKRHSEFHRALISECASPTYLRFCAILHDQFDRYRRLAPSDDNIRAQLDSQHLQIMELALARKADAAGELLAEHIQLSAASAFKLFA